MQAATILAALQKAAQAPRMAGIYIKHVEIAAVHDWQHDPVLRITWSMPDASAAIDAPAWARPGVAASIISRPSDACLLLARDLASPDELESAILSAAWSLGAWDVVRFERAPLAAGTDWRDARHALAVDFGHNTYSIGGQPLATGDAADERVCEVAANHGWVTWAFVPLALATPTARKRWGIKDRTLRPDCTRAGEPSAYRAAWRHPTEPRMAHEHIYELGRRP